MKSTTTFWQDIVFIVNDKGFQGRYTTMMIGWMIGTTISVINRGFHLGLILLTFSLLHFCAFIGIIIAISIMRRVSIK